MGHFERTPQEHADALYRAYLLGEDKQATLENALTAIVHAAEDTAYRTRKPWRILCELASIQLDAMEYVSFYRSPTGGQRVTVDGLYNIDLDNGVGRRQLHMDMMEYGEDAHPIVMGRPLILDFDITKESRAELRTLRAGGAAPIISFVGAAAVFTPSEDERGLR